MELIRPHKQGWLGPEAERRAWEDARVDEDIALFAGEAREKPLYREYDEAEGDILARITYFKGRPFTWNLERKLHATGRLPHPLIPTHTQDTGNCVAAGLAGAGMKLQMIEISIGGQEEKFREWFVPWIYAVSRNQIYSGMSGAGSTGVWGAKAVNEYGVLFTDDADVPPYEGTSDRWGQRKYAGQISRAIYGGYAKYAKDNPVEITRLTSVDQMVNVMDAGMQITIASKQGFRVSTYKGLHVYKPAGAWSHQMHITDIRRDPELMFYRMNQWGPGHTKPLNGETPGGAWNFASDLEKELHWKQVEVYGYSRFKGHPGAPDFNIV